MNKEEIIEIIKSKRKPLNSMRELSNRLMGTTTGFFYYTSNFRLDFETKMARLGQLESNWKTLKEWLIESYMLYVPMVADGSQMTKVLNKMNELEGDK